MYHHHESSKNVVYFNFHTFVLSSIFEVIFLSLFPAFFRNYSYIFGCFSPFCKFLLCRNFGIWKIIRACYYTWYVMQLMYNKCSCNLVLLYTCTITCNIFKHAFIDSQNHTFRYIFNFLNHFNNKIKFWPNFFIKFIKQSHEIVIHNHITKFTYIFM